MDEEKKVYSIVGTVTIGTDEYRDLIQAKFEAQRQADNLNSKWYEEYKKVLDLQKQVNALKAKIEKCEKFIKKNTKSEDDTISVIFSLFGEE